TAPQDARDEHDADRRAERRAAHEHRGSHKDGKDHSPSPTPREPGPEAESEGDSYPEDRRAHRRPRLQLAGFCPAAGRERDLAEGLEQHDVELRFLSIARKRQLGEDLALTGRDVAR